MLSPEIIEQFKEGLFRDENEQVRVMRNVLLTVRQRQEIFQAGLEISDILNGRYPANSTLIPELFKDWNSKLGFECFRTL